MRNRIQRSMVCIVVVTLLLSYILLTVVAYQQARIVLETELKQETKYIQRAVELSGDWVLREMDLANQMARVTRISPDGEVLYDSAGNPNEFENHKNRKEVKQAMETGRGSDVRFSTSLDKDMYYYAVKMNDGTILRVSKERDGVLSMAVEVLPYISVIAVFTLVLSVLLSKWQVNRLIRPINELDLEHPMKNSIYEELTPLLVSMEQKNIEKEKAEQIRREFSANVSHELKTPLTSISGYAEIIKNGMVCPEDIPVFAERIYKEAGRLIVLIDDIIQLSRLDEKKMEDKKEQIDLMELCKEVYTRAYPYAQRRQVTLTVLGEDVTVYGIRRILEEMIYNLCDNAIKYNKEGGRVQIWAGATIDGAKVVVEDSGIGIPEEEMERIYERFYRVDKSRSKESGGTGLGLSIVKHGAILHHAKIETESEVGKGTRISIYFPKSELAGEGKTKFDTDL